MIIIKKVKINYTEDEYNTLREDLDCYKDNLKH